MTTLNLVDPELAPLLDSMAPPPFLPESSTRGDTEQGSVLARLGTARARLPRIRAEYNRRSDEVAAAAPAYPDVEVAERYVPGPEGAPEVRVVTYLPNVARRPVPALLWIHGGGYMLGRAYESDPVVRRIASAVRCAVVSVDYRLAPETPHPGPVEDCYAALAWLHAHAAELGVDADRLAIGGDSAGGGLTAALALLARDRGDVSLAFQLLIYPMLDDRTASTRDPNPHVGEFVWTRRDNTLGWAALLAREPGGEDVSPYAAAARAENLAGLPPAFIGVGALDLFLEEDLEYARRLLRAPVPTELRVYPGAPHGFLNAPARVGQALMRDCVDALARAVHPGQPHDGVRD